jgi:hypothetical protein
MVNGEEADNSSGRSDRNIMITGAADGMGKVAGQPHARARTVGKD